MSSYMIHFKNIYNIQYYLYSHRYYLCPLLAKAECIWLLYCLRYSILYPLAHDLHGLRNSFESTICRISCALFMLTII